jgi:putative SOS response-associated peptidase YedK
VSAMRGPQDQHHLRSETDRSSAGYLMCNLYSETKGQDAIRGLFRVRHDRTGNLPSFPAIFPDQMAPIVRNAEGGNRELVLARWGMPGPVQ